MLDFPRWKILGISFLCLIGILLAVPSLFPESQTAKWPSWVPDARINLGLDLAGGSHLLLEAETGDVAKLQLESMEEIIRGEMRRASPRRIEIGEISSAGGRLTFMVRDSSQVDAAVDL